MEKAIDNIQHFVRNPLGVIALFMFFCYSVFAIVFAHGIDNKDLNTPMLHFVEMYMSNENLTSINLCSEKKEQTDSLLTISKGSPNQLTLICDGMGDSSGEQVNLD